MLVYGNGLDRSARSSNFMSPRSGGVYVSIFLSTSSRWPISSTVLWDKNTIWAGSMENIPFLVLGETNLKAIMQVLLWQLLGSKCSL
eukprot:scaffold5605_cov128-Cylindrotheca_fusiformis.AAC.1